MEFFNAFLSTEVLAGVLIVGAFSMGIRSILHFSREATDLRPRLSEVDRELNKRRDGTDELRKQVGVLNAEVAPIRSRESSLRAYYEELQALLIDHERREHQKSTEAETDRRKRVQRRKMGMRGE